MAAAAIRQAMSCAPGRRGLARGSHEVRALGLRPVEGFVQRRERHRM
jgi:hypothetical protein